MASRVQITKYRVVAPWRDKVTNREIFCLEVYVVGRGWHGVLDDGAIVSFETKREARTYIAKLKSERTKSGFKKRSAA